MVTRKMTRRMLWMVGTQSLLLLAFRPHAAFAQTSTCTISASPMNLGAYTGVRQISGTGSLTVRCPSSTSYEVKLDAGTGAGATTTTRKMTGPGSAVLNYKLYQYSARTLNWGNQPGVDTRTGSGTGFNQTLTIYPEIPAGQTLLPGTYTDTITASLYPDGSAASFLVTATIVPACTISATAMGFGIYAALAVRATATITANCTVTTAWSIGLNEGTTAGASTSKRMMTGPSGRVLTYDLFRTNSYTNIWGSMVNVDTSTGTGTGAAQTMTVYGQIRADQHVSPGAYSDAVIATITY